MKVLICGAGRAARTVLSYLGPGWNATVVAKGGELQSFIKEFEGVSAVFGGDASSPVVLARAGLAAHDWVLALTSDDEVNLAVVRFAAESGVRHIVGRAVDPASRQAMQDAGARAFSGVAAMAADIVQYLRNPRVRVISVAQGKGQLLEIEVARASGLAGRTPAELDAPGWSVAAVYRAGHMVRNPSDQPLVDGDVVVVATRPGMYEDVCRSMECTRSDFPHSYGPTLLASLAGVAEGQHKELLAECMHVAQALRMGGVVLVADAEARPVRDALAMWSGSVDIRVAPQGDKPMARMEELAGVESVGLAMVPWAEQSLLRTLARRTPLDLAHSMGDPLLVAKGSDPYRRILVPFTGSEATELALDAALQMAPRFGASVAVVLVREPAFLMGAEADWVDEAVRLARDLGREHGLHPDEIVREGNPVHEITGLARDYDLVVLGSGATSGRGFLTPDVGRHIVDKAPCSVLVVTR